MNYDYSFTRTQVTLLFVLSLSMAILLVTTGYLIGRIASTPVVAAPVIAAPPQNTTAAAAPSAKPDTAIPTDTPIAMAPNSVVTPQAVSGLSAKPSAAVPSAAIAPDIGAARPTSAPAGQDAGYVLQYGAFRDVVNARDLVKRLGAEDVPATVRSMRNGAGDTFSVVRGASFPTIGQAREAASEQSSRLSMTVVVRPAGHL